MSGNTNQPGPATILQAFFDLGRAGRIDDAFALWAPDAIWRLQGHGPRARDYKLAEYRAMSMQWLRDFPDYTADFGPIIEAGELAFFTMRSRGGEAPGETGGVMLYRIVDGLITEGWGIPADHGGRFGF